MLHGSYSSVLVFMSVLVAVMAAYTTIDMARRVASTRERASRWWLIGGAVASGIGIWAMHFVGMLAFTLPIPMGWDPGITFASLLIAILASGFALWLTARDKLPWMTLCAGALMMGAGISGMHYTGMAAMRMHPAISYEPFLFWLSIAVSIVVSGIGLHLIHKLRTAESHIHLLRLAAALLIGGSIVGMHYIAMAAARFPLGTICGAATGGLNTGWVASIVIVASLGVLTMALVISILDQRMQSRTAALASSLENANRRLSQLALHDSLTRLPNRLLLDERLGRWVTLPRPFALMYLDLDGFKPINDAYGHHVGDQLLVELAQRLLDMGRSDDIVVRLGGDEFVLGLHVQHRGEAEALAQRVLDRVHEPMVIAGETVQVSTSIGIALYPEDGTEAAVLQSNADAAMYCAKGRGYGGFCFYDASMHSHARERLHLRQALAPALAAGEFYLLYQPKYSAADGKLVGVEALCRWKHPPDGIIGPDVFIPLAEASGVIIDLGAWVLDTACKQLAAWNQLGRAVEMSVNVSVVQFGSPRLIEDVAQCLARYRLSPASLTLEITESTAMQDVEHSQRMLRQLRELGVKISIDDFGTGYSSLAYLKRLPASELKIDRQFVGSLQQSKEDAAIVSTIIAMARTLGLTVTAEGVETEVQKQFLDTHGCDLLQGFLLGRPALPGDIDLDRVVGSRAAVQVANVGGQMHSVP